MVIADFLLEKYRDRRIGIRVKKIVLAKMIQEAMLSVQNLVKVIYAVKNLKRQSFIDSFFNEECGINKLGTLSEEIIENVNRHKDNPKEFYAEYLNIRFSSQEEYEYYFVDLPECNYGISSPLISIIRMLVGLNIKEGKILHRIFNAIKHGFSVIDYGDNSKMIGVIYNRKEKPEKIRLNDSTIEFFYNKVLLSNSCIECLIGGATLSGNSINSN